MREDLFARNREDGRFMARLEFGLRTHGGRGWCEGTTAQRSQRGALAAPCTRAVLAAQPGVLVTQPGVLMAWCTRGAVSWRSGSEAGAP